MSNKLYYDDPIEALYMGRRYKLKFDALIDDGLMRMFKNYSYVALLDNIRDVLDKEEWAYGMKYYIQPDDYHIFKPLAGDLVLDHDNEYQIVWKDHKGLAVDSSAGTKSPDGCPIIQRSNKHFFMPKEERDDE